ncbi:cytochrome b N-terminal domain-containing protein [Carboxylicivirga caseinilyticus]|uniref:cytochrome b N-terminal domain-containing protein n=1 Tax=Carboxylicivirga caseinilyticus TaxID=3417572 RepID=UPI003D3491F8|nr:cytochrome b N-terminal domain-containing protein [Marinilabiliaceae bacterium A049]
MNTAGHSKAITKLLLHLHPNKVDAQSIKFTRTFGLGGIAALLFVMLFISGMLLRFAYVPSVKGAYDSIIELENQVLFGQLLRNLHYWSGMALVLVSFLHVLRVFYTQSIYHERRKNWIYGLLIMFLVVFSNFTGYLLPWDQLSFWAVTIMTNMLSYIPFVGDAIADMVRGGDEVTEITLLRFYHFHTGLLPLLMVFLMSVHFWLVRKSKGVTVQNSDEKVLVPTYPNLVFKEILVALIVIIVLFILSMIINAPLQGKADPLISPNPSKAPWYFMGFQELLLHIHPGFGIFIIPLLVTVFLVYIPFVKYTDLNVGVWFNSNKGKKLTIISVVYALVLTLLVILSSEFFLDLRNWMPQVPLLISTGLLLLLLYLVPAAAFLYFLKSKYNASKIDLMMAMFTIIIVAYVVMTIVGSLFRGEGMHLFA